MKCRNFLVSLIHQLMSLIRIQLIFLLWLAATQGYTQDRKPYYSREVSVSLDNDIIFFEDYYYTAGMDVTYRRILKPQSFLFKLGKPHSSVDGDSTKVIFTGRAGAKIYTPFDILKTDPKDMDRAYAGWSYVDLEISNFPKPSASNSYLLEVGLTGPSSGMEKVQKWMHHITGFDQPAGWKYQLPDEVAVNIRYQRMQQIPIFKELDMINTARVEAGTVTNQVSDELVVRMGDFKPLNNSVFANSRLSWDNREQGLKRPIEFFLLCGIGVNYILSDMFIQGSLVTGTPSPIPASVNPWVTQARYGLMISTQSISFGLNFYHRAGDLKNGATHDWVSGFLAVRF